MKVADAIAVLCWAALAEKCIADVAFPLNEEEIRAMVTSCTETEKTRYYDCLDQTVIKCLRDVRGVRFEMISAKHFCCGKVKDAEIEILQLASRFRAGLGWNE